MEQYRTTTYPPTQAEGKTVMKETVPSPAVGKAEIQPRINQPSLSTTETGATSSTTNVPLAPPSRAVGVSRIDRSIIDSLRYQDNTHIQEYINRNYSDMDRLIHELQLLREQYNNLLPNLINERNICNNYEQNTMQALLEASNYNHLGLQMIQDYNAHNYIMQQFAELMKRENHVVQSKEAASIGAVRQRDSYTNTAFENEKLFERSINKFNEIYNNLINISYEATNKLNNLRNKQDTFYKGMQELDTQFLARAEQEIRKREAEAEMNKIEAEKAAQSASKSKAVEEAALQSSRKLQEEEERVMASLREQQMRAEALAREREQLLLTSDSAKVKSDAETQRAAELAAESIARQKEIELLQTEEERTRSRLMGLGALGGTAAVLAGGTAMGSHGGVTPGGSSLTSGASGTNANAPVSSSSGMMVPSNMNPFMIPLSNFNMNYQPLQVLWAPNGLESLQSMTSSSMVSSPPQTVPNYVLHARLMNLHNLGSNILTKDTGGKGPTTGVSTTSAALGTNIPSAVAFRIHLGNTYALSDPVPLRFSGNQSSGNFTLPLNFVATLPIYNQVLSNDDILSMDILDASSMLMKGGTMVSMNSLPQQVQLHRSEINMGKGNTEPAVLGRALVIINHLTDGHLSKNTFQFAGVSGGAIDAELQMGVPQMYNPKMMVPSGNSMYSWLPIENTWLFVPVPSSLLLSSMGSTGNQSMGSSTNFGNANYPTTATSSTISSASSQGSSRVVSV